MERIGKVILVLLLTPALFAQFTVGSRSFGPASGGGVSLTVSTAGTGSGSLSGTNCSSGSYASGTTVTCTESASSGSVFTGWSGACSGMGTCSFSLSGTATVTATFTATLAQELNLDDTLTGWTICTLPGCNPGGVDTPASDSQTISNASPSIDGASMLISETTNATSTQTNILFYNSGSACDSCTHFVSEFRTYITNLSNASSMEFDAAKANFSANRVNMWGSQCEAGGFWQIANDVSSWTNTSVPCTMTGGAWHHILWTYHMIIGDTGCGGLGCNYYDTLTVDGTTYTINMTEPSESLGWGSTLIDQFQIDIGSTSGTAKTVSENIDKVSFSAW